MHCIGKKLSQRFNKLQSHNNHHDKRKNITVIPEQKIMITIFTTVRSATRKIRQEDCVKSNEKEKRDKTREETCCMYKRELKIFLGRLQEYNGIF